MPFKKNNLNKFKESIDISTLEFLNSTLTHEINKEIELFRKDFFNILKTNKINKEPKDWWSISTKRINILSENIEYVMNEILKESVLLKEQLTYNIYTSIIFFIIALLSLLISIIMLKKLTKQEQDNFINLNKLKQIYNILSYTNELIVYDYKMKDVLKQACFSAKKELDLSLSFVCVLNEKKEFEIIESSYSKDINIDFINPNKENTLYQKSFFENKPIIVDDIDENPSFDFEGEKKNKIKSIATHPIFKEKEQIGLLVFCSETTHFFDKQIIEIFSKMANDISFGIQKEQKEQQKLQYEEELRIASYAFDSQEAMAITDLNASILKVNNAFTEITGYDQDEVIGKNPNILKSGKHDEDFYSNMWQTLLNDGYWSGEIYNKRKNGEIYPEKTTITAIKNKHGAVTHFIAQFFDITEIKKSQEKLIYEIQHDALTGLYNRTVLNERLEESIVSANRHSHFGAVLFLDLDNFKYINDSLGHNIGDLVLKKIANSLQELSRKEDLIIRLGGDEFIILVHNLGANRQKAISQVETFAYRIIEALEVPQEIDNYKLTTTSSIGIALFPEFDKDAHEIIKNADSAMYKAKKQGKNQIMFFYDDLDAESKHYLKVENELRKAIKNDEFELYYQAKYNHQTKKIIGYEALLRWNHPTKGVLTPDEFIYIAEESSLIINIGKWVIKNCCQQINTWLNEGIDLNNIKISINISTIELEQVDFIENVKNILEETNTDPKYLEIEITETSMFKNIDFIIKKIEELKELGIHCTIDDFGVGFSSLNYISKLPVNIIKLDKNFIMNKHISVNEAIIDMVIKITNDLKIDLIIEGVETQEDIEYLSKKNSFLYQGYHISRPIKVDEAIKLINN